MHEYDIKSAEDIQDALKDSFGVTIKEMLKAEISEHLDYDTYERPDIFRNGHKQKQIRSKYGEITNNVHQD